MSDPEPSTAAAVQRHGINEKLINPLKKYVVAAPVAACLDLPRAMAATGAATT